VPFHPEGGTLRVPSSSPLCRIERATVVVVPAPVFKSSVTRVGPALNLDVVTGGREEHDVPTPRASHRCGTKHRADTESRSPCSSPREGVVCPGELRPSMSANTPDRRLPRQAILDDGRCHLGSDRGLCRMVRTRSSTSTRLSQKLAASSMPAAMLVFVGDLIHDSICWRCR